MTINTSPAGQAVIPIDVTLRALQAGMRSGQGEAGAGMVESRSSPGRSVVALLASLGEIGHDVIGVGGALVVLEVTGDAGVVGEVVIVINVAIAALAWRNGMRAGQRKTGGRVVEAGICPRRGVVAGSAGSGNARLRVVGIGRSLVILKVTAHTGGAGEIEISIGMAL